MRHLLLCILLSALGHLHARPKPAQRLVPAAAPQVENELPDTFGGKYNIRSIPFVDSMLTDSLREHLAAPFKVHPPKEKRGRFIDPNDPFLKENYIRKGLGRFWFFVVNLIILGLILYFRSAFYNQMVLRVRSLFNAYHFRELTSDSGITFTSGSVVAALISTLVMGQAVIVIVVYSGYVQLNSIIFYILVVIGLSLWRVLLFFIQSIQAFVLEISPLARNQLQRQLNIDLGFSLLMFPIATLAYYNSSRLMGLDVALAVAITVTVWIGFRLIFEFLGMLRESGFSFSGILYFCTFEILPHAVLLTALFRDIEAK